MTAKRTDVWTTAACRSGGLGWLLGGAWIACRHAGAWQPPTDVYEDDDALVVRVEVAGMRGEDFSISLAGRTLIVSGVRDDTAPKRTYHQMEIRFGAFRVEVHLPWAVDPESVQASYDEGLLQVRLPRSGARRVPVVEAEPEMKPKMEPEMGTEMGTQTHTQTEEDSADGCRT